jgi:hypothetical protein
MYLYVYTTYRLSTKVKSPTFAIFAILKKSVFFSLIMKQASKPTIPI